MVNWENLDLHIYSVAIIKPDILSLVFMSDKKMYIGIHFNKAEISSDYKYCCLHKSRTRY